MASFATLVSSTRSAVTIPQISVAAQSTVIGITPLAFGASPTISAPQVVTSTPNSIASSSTRIASLSGTLQTTTASDVPSSLSTVLVQKSYATSTSVLPQATSVIAPTKISSFDLQPLPTSTGDPLLSMATSMPSSSKAPLSQFEAPTAPSPLPPGFPSASVTVVLITTPNPSLTQAPAYQTSIASTTALLASTPVVPTPAFTIIPVKNNATPTITKTVTETVTVSATVTLRG
ncbi:hypothetical protein MMC34_008259 [Xylographa carneopallida]|nr:hypothetical protein [Xylographa carneopallida]